MHRALKVGALQHILPPADLRPYLICAVERGLNGDKEAVCVLALSDIEIRSALFGAPEVFLGNEPAPVSISLSHRAGVGACALAPSCVPLGCDLESVEPHGDAFAADYFTAEEQALVAEAEAADRLWLLALLWSGKESALKVLREGLRLDTRHVIVRTKRTLYNALVSPFQHHPNTAAGVRCRFATPTVKCFTVGGVKPATYCEPCWRFPTPDPPILLAQECADGSVEGDIPVVAFTGKR